MTLAEEFGIRAVDPLLRDLDAQRAERKITRVALADDSRRRGMLGLLAALENEEGRMRIDLFAAMPPSATGKGRDMDAVFYGARDTKLIEHSTERGMHNRMLWRITAKGRRRLAELRAERSKA